MIYSIIYDAVRHKARTTPPNIFIANTEMAAGVGIILSQTGQHMNLEEIKAPGDIQNRFAELYESGTLNLNEEQEILADLIKKYKLRDMVNETMEDLLYLIQHEK